MRRTTFLALGCLVGLPALAGPKLEYDASTEQFGTDGPVWASVAEVVVVHIADEDPRRVWSLQVDYERPVEAGLSGAMGTLADVVAAAAGGFKGAGVEDDLRIALGIAVEQTETYLGQATATEADFQSLADTYEHLEQTAEGYAEQMRLEDLPEAPLTRAREALQVWRRIQDTAERARKSRTQDFMVKKGFERVVVKACHEQLTFVSNAVAWKPESCGGSRYLMQVDNPGGAVELMPGWVIPFEGGSPGRGRALVAIGSSVMLHSGSQTKLGVDLGAAMGSESLAPSAYTLGPHLSVAGVSLGGGIALVQSTVEGEEGFGPGPYLRIGLAPNFMERVKSMTSDKGAQNADPVEPEADEDLITMPGPMAAQPPRPSSPEPEPATEEGGETEEPGGEAEGDEAPAPTAPAEGSPVVNPR